MAKNNFLLVDLQEAKGIAETITSDTSRKILDYLTEKEATESNIASSLKLPLSTVHYHLQKLQEAGLVVVEEFHYSTKGKEVNHYKLANKYIIIAPKRIEGLGEKLKGLLPLLGIVVVVSGVIKLITLQTAVVGTRNVADEAAPMLLRAAPVLLEETPKQMDMALVFLIGGLVVVGLYGLYLWVQLKWKSSRDI